MKTLLFALLLLSSQLCFPQAAITEEEKIEHLIQVWGLLKYHHPGVSRGEFDLNREFIAAFETLETIQSRADFDKSLLAWVKKFGTFKLKPNAGYVKEKALFAKNANFEWIDDSGFSEELQSLLTQIRTNTNYKDHYASVNRWSSSIEFNETGLADFDVSNKAHRMLFLASFWNAMNYWNVNIHLSKQSWAKVLPEMVSQFRKNQASEFEVAKEKLFSRLSDSHSNYYPSSSLKALTQYPAFGGRIINDSLVVNVIFDEKIAKEDGIAIGDVIYAVEEIPIGKYYRSKFEEVISVSNENYLKRSVEKSWLLASDKDSVKVKVLKNNDNHIEKYIQLKKLSYPAENYMRMRPDKTEPWKKLSEEIGYLNLQYITNEELKMAFGKFEGFKGIVIDLRNYPRNISHQSLPKYLFPHKKKFVMALTPVLPSFGNANTKAALRFIQDPFSAGKRNKNYYKGKVILLIDRTTLSQAEWIGMAIQASPNCLTLGEQTGGAVLNRNAITLMDNTSIDFTQAGAFYPDGINAQGNGLKIDIEIQESARNYNKDLYIETAVAFIEGECL